MVVEFGDGETLMSTTRVGVAVLVGKPEISAACVELCVDLLVGGGDGYGVGELSVGEASAQNDACAVEWSRCRRIHAAAEGAIAGGGRRK